MLVRDRCERLAGRALERRVVDDMQIAGCARTFRTQSGDQRVHRHDVVVDDQIEARKLALQCAPIDLMMFGDEVVSQERAGAAPGRNALIPEMHVIEARIEFVDHVHPAGAEHEQVRLIAGGPQFAGRSIDHLLGATEGGVRHE
ncbi:hypothetical protein D9M68_439150 [compost metagenome]